MRQPSNLTAQPTSPPTSPAANKSHFGSFDKNCLQKLRQRWLKHSINQASQGSIRKNKPYHRYDDQSNTKHGCQDQLSVQSNKGANRDEVRNIAAFTQLSRFESYIDKDRPLLSSKLPINHSCLMSQKGFYCPILMESSLRNSKCSNSMTPHSFNSTLVSRDNLLGKEFKIERANTNLLCQSYSETLNKSSESEARRKVSQSEVPNKGQQSEMLNRNKKPPINLASKNPFTNSTANHLYNKLRTHTKEVNANIDNLFDSLTIIENRLISLVKSRQQRAQKMSGMAYNFRQEVSQLIKGHQTVIDLQESIIQNIHNKTNCDDCMNHQRKNKNNSNGNITHKSQNSSDCNNKVDNINTNVTENQPYEGTMTFRIQPLVDIGQSNNNPNIQNKNHKIPPISDLQCLTTNMNNPNNRHEIEFRQNSVQISPIMSSRIGKVFQTKKIGTIRKNIQIDSYSANNNSNSYVRDNIIEMVVSNSNSNVIVSPQSNVIVSNTESNNNNDSHMSLDSLQNNSNLTDQTQLLHSATPKRRQKYWEEDESESEGEGEGEGDRNPLGGNISKQHSYQQNHINSHMIDYILLSKCTAIEQESNHSSNLRNNNHNQNCSTNNNSHNYSNINSNNGSNYDYFQQMCHKIQLKIHKWKK